MVLKCEQRCFLENALYGVFFCCFYNTEWCFFTNDGALNFNMLCSSNARWFNRYSPDGASLGIQLGSLLGAKVGIHTLLGTALGIVILENNKYTLEITHFTI